MFKQQVYLDHNATTPIHIEVKKAMISVMDIFGNPSSLHSLGRQAKELIEDARERVASFIGADSQEIIFVGSGSEANNTVLSTFGCLSQECASRRKMRSNIVTTHIEHPCILETSKCLSDRGLEVVHLSVDLEGKVNLKQLKERLNDKVGLVSIMMANNEIGVIQDIKTIAEIVHEKGALFHSDAVQTVGKIPVNVKDLNVDFLTLSAHKIYGPKGVGALYVRKGIPFCSLIRGGHQEKGRRAGTENTLGVVGLGKAIEMRDLEMEEEKKKLLALKSALRKGIENNIPDVKFNGHPTDCLPGTLNVSFPGAEGEAILLYLDLEDIAVSTGSACASGSLEPSHVLLACGLNAEQAHGSIRISLGKQNTIEEVNYVLEVLPRVIKKIRAMSTVRRTRSQK